VRTRWGRKTIDRWRPATVVLPMRGLSLPLTSATQHDLARLPHDHERHVGWQDRIVARDLSQIVRLWVGLTFVDFLFAFVPLPRPEGVSGMTMTTTSCEGPGKGAEITRPGVPNPLSFSLDLRHSQVVMSNEDQTSEQMSNVTTKTTTHVKGKFTNPQEAARRKVWHP
jgi:hypothetical protein